MSDQHATEERAITALVRPIAEQIAHLSSDGRITLLTALLAQEICLLPPAQRQNELRRLLDELPDILDWTEAAMRQALAENARKGL